MALLQYVQQFFVLLANSSLYNFIQIQKIETSAAIGETNLYKVLSKFMELKFLHVGNGFWASLKLGRGGGVKIYLFTEELTVPILLVHGKERGMQL
jgi:hypothetical protein